MKSVSKMRRGHTPQVSLNNPNCTESLVLSLQIKNYAIGRIKSFNILTKSETAQKARITARKSGDFTLEFSNSSDRDSFVNDFEYNKPFGQDGHYISACSLQPSTVVLKGIPSWVSEEDLDLYLKEILNPGFTFQRFYKNGRSIPVGKLSLNSRAEATSLVRMGIEVGFQKIRCEWFKNPATRCFRCQQFGHIANFCKEVERCLFCGGDHNMKMCPIKGKTEKKCINCGLSGHLACYGGCSSAKAATEQLKKQLSAGTDWQSRTLKNCMVKSGGR
ncbi:uncharacterized protein LOC115232066 [Octopus sinensis]|uniref:Uncharacterized protein LOC115232066 n=1 Tax=Octopus sinensis TaxID=2607531 RepID=A0A6P7U8V1_9MOLL|nr:uncharacterized protein LOC115232066 [Octopus sinensis]